MPSNHALSRLKDVVSWYTQLRSVHQGSNVRCYYLIIYILPATTNLIYFIPTYLDGQLHDPSYLSMS
jgi:hypothetical protein